MSPGSWETFISETFIESWTQRRRIFNTQRSQFTFFFQQLTEYHWSKIYPSLLCFAFFSWWLIWTSKAPWKLVHVFRLKSSILANLIWPCATNQYEKHPLKKVKKTVSSFRNSSSDINNLWYVLPVIAAWSDGAEQHAKSQKRHFVLQPSTKGGLLIIITITLHPDEQHNHNYSPSSWTA